jgi:hypothetical protein
MDKKIGEVTLQANKAVKKGDATTMSSLFTMEELQKPFTVLSRVAPNIDIQIHIAKLGELTTKAQFYPPLPIIPKEKTAFRWITPKDAREEALHATDDIKKGEDLTVTFEWV